MKAFADLKFTCVADRNLACIQVKKLARSCSVRWSSQIIEEFSSLYLEGVAYRKPRVSLVVNNI